MKPCLLSVGISAQYRIIRTLRVFAYFAYFSCSIFFAQPSTKPQARKISRHVKVGPPICIHCGEEKSLKHYLKSLLRRFCSSEKNIFSDYQENRYIFIQITMPLPRTSYATLIARRIPYLAVWGSGLTFFLGWPHVWIAVSNMKNEVPPINSAYL